MPFVTSPCSSLGSGWSDSHPGCAWVWTGQAGPGKKRRDGSSRVPGPVFDRKCSSGNLPDSTLVLVGDLHPLATRRFHSISSTTAAPQDEAQRTASGQADLLLPEAPNVSS